MSDEHGRPPRVASAPAEGARRLAMVAALFTVSPACSTPAVPPAISIAAPPVLAAKAPAPPAAASRRFEITYEAALENVPATSRTAYLWLPYPPADEEQSIGELHVTSDMPYEVVTEPRYGNRSLRFRGQAGVARQTATLRFEVERREHVHRPVMMGSPAKTPVTASDGDTARWLGPDRRVPIDERVHRLAEETVAGKKTPVEKARAIYDYTVSELKYDKRGEGWGRGDIYWACDNKRGNCTDFHAIFTGFSRALGIPARFEIGLSVPADRPSGEIAGYHCWAEFYLEGFGWVPVDASEANKNPALRDYFFGAHDQNRVLFTVGRDLVLPGMEGEPLNYFVYPYAEVDGVASPSVTKRFAFRDAEAR